METARTWTFRSTKWPRNFLPNKGNLPLVYDSKRQRVVAFVRGETFEWDDKVWSKVAGFGPKPRDSCSFVFNDAAGTALLFGGDDPKEGLQAMAAPWEWNGSGWTQLPAFGPAPRSLTAMAYDNKRDRMVVFGGVTEKNEAPFSDTWEWDGTGWSPVAAGAPPVRFAHAMTFDAQRGKVVLFGGVKAELGDLLADTWEWNGRNWTQLSDIGPLKRRDHAMVFDEVRGRVLLFGGETNLPTPDPDGRREWDGRNWTQLSDSGPGVRSRHGLVYDKARKCVVLFGGFKQFVNPETWEWKPNAIVALK